MAEENKEEQKTRVIEVITSMIAEGGLDTPTIGPALQDSTGMQINVPDITLREDVHSEFSFLSWLATTAKEKLRAHLGKYVRLTITVEEILRDGYYIEALDLENKKIRNLFLCELDKKENIKMFMKRFGKNKRYTFFKIMDGERKDMSDAEVKKITGERKKKKKGTSNASNKRRSKTNTEG